jgi:hypothetical protein
MDLDCNAMNLRKLLLDDIRVSPSIRATCLEKHRITIMRIALCVPGVTGEFYPAAHTLLALNIEGTPKLSKYYE